MVKKILLGCGLPLLLVSVLAFFGVRSLLKAKPKPERAETVRRGDVEVKVVENGTIEPLRKVEVKSKVGGRIARLWVDAGAVVRRRQTLATIDPTEINSQVAALEAQLAGAQAQLAAALKGATYQSSQTTAGIDQNAQNLAVAEARLRMAETEAGAQPKLTQQGIDIAQANLEAAKATLKAQQDNLRLMQESTHPQNVVNAQSAYDQARAQADNAARNLQRQKQLVAKGFVSGQAVDTAQTDVQVAEARSRETKARLDRIHQTNALEAANARSQVANAQGMVKQMEASLLQAKTSVLPLTRQQELQSARAAYQQAKAQLTAARSGKTQDLMRTDEARASESNVTQIKNKLDELKVRQRDTTLIASMAGIVTKRYVEEGELVSSALESFSSGTAIFQISDLSTMLIKININEVDIAKVKRGLLTEVTIDSYRGATFLGRVGKVAPAALSEANASGASSAGQTVIRFPVEIRMDKADPRLRPGMSARCALIVARRRQVLRLPINCVQIGEGGKGTVQVVTTAMKDGQSVEKATPREVVLGLRGDDFVEIVSGVNEGEKARPSAYTGPPRKAVDIFDDDKKRD